MFIRTLAGLCLGVFLVAACDQPSDESVAGASTAVGEKAPDEIDDAITALKYFRDSERDKAAIEALRIHALIQARIAKLQKGDAGSLKAKSAETAAAIAMFKDDKNAAWWQVANGYASSLLGMKQAYDAEARKSGK